jgi:hypothetical protein
VLDIHPLALSAESYDAQATSIPGDNRDGRAQIEHAMRQTYEAA